MGFTTSAFIRRNTPEIRARLEELGYRIAKNAYQFHGLSVNCYCQGNGICYGLSKKEEMKFSLNHKRFRNCGTNEELFLALAALNNENDYMQWFISSKGNWYLCEWLMLGMAYMDIELSEIWRKASCEELIEHFK